MKRIADLTPADLDRVPVWRYEGDDDAVATITATDAHELSDRGRGTFIARTQFVLASGAQFTGFCSPTRDPGLAYLQPVIVTHDGPVYFWFEEPPTTEFLELQARRLRENPDEVFPVHFRCTVPVSGRFVTGTITVDDVTGAA